jgi:hypothetical protein
MKSDFTRHKSVFTLTVMGFICFSRDFSDDAGTIGSILTPNSVLSNSIIRFVSVECLANADQSLLPLMHSQMLVDMWRLHELGSCKFRMFYLVVFCPLRS